MPNYLEDLYRILRECFFLSSTASTTKLNHLLNDDVLKRAVERSMGIVASVTSDIPESIRNKYPQVAWKQFLSWNDLLQKDCNADDFKEIWAIIKTKVPVLKEKISNIKDQELRLEKTPQFEKV